MPRVSVQPDDVGGQEDRFHKRGAAEQKARSPMVRSLVLGTRRSELPVDLRARPFLKGHRKRRGVLNEQGSESDH
ncbi:hypothetical protein EYF80_012736 [Liparis tanakae]|uniref:Uncharacterized protein n=1 Tax=Liparis tanakae TaxID=230148 RepID=A0A4Z2IGX2_9TELE|nr:hypothetical protein EYF80_012736 [Liparis tanakae]